MKICIDLTSLSYHITGIERYALGVTAEMLKQDKENEYILVFRNEVYKTLAQYVDGARIQSMVLQGKNKLLFMQIILPIALYKIKADVFLFMAFPNPILFARKGIYVTIHDLCCFDAAETMGFLQKIYFQVSFKRTAHIAEKIFTVSYFSKNRIEKILKVDENKVVVTYSAIPNSLQTDAEYDYSVVKEKYKLPELYILNVSTLEPRKNLKLLLEAYNQVAGQVDYDLVLIGRTGWKMEKILSQYQFQDRIHITGFVDDDDLTAIYKNALCFVFPSIYEGFGLPPVEALAFGCPVIASDATCLPEILRKQAVYFKNNDVVELKRILICLSKMVDSMPTCLEDYQRNNYSFCIVAKKILNTLWKLL